MTSKTGTVCRIRIVAGKKVLADIGEEWRAIPGFALYEASSMGRIRSLDRRIAMSRGGTRLSPGQIIKGRPNMKRGGYHYVALCEDGQQLNRRVHILVMRAFVGPVPEGQEVRHLNSDPADNRLINLAYGSKSENAQDSLALGRHANANKTRCPRGHLLVEPNLRPALLRRGIRCCLSCNRAWAYAHHHRAPGERTVLDLTVADRFYAELNVERDKAVA